MARGPGPVRVASPAEGHLARLIIAEGKRAGATAELSEQTISVGRLAACELAIEEPQASRKHFEVVRRGHDTWLKDLGSRNGTFLNEERVSGEAKLEEGDRIRVGATVIVYEAAPAALAPGTALGPYEITSTVERRRGLTVHEARHASLNRIVLVDVLEPNDPQAPRFLERARLSSAFDHPSLLAIYDAGEHEGRAYRVREVLVEARDVEARLREGALDIEVAIAVARQVAEGLAHIHAKQAVHGQLTPRVILLDERGLAKLELAGEAPGGRLDPERADARLQALSASPEEARGLEPTAASDVYALGCILYRMMAGVPPWDGDFPAVVRGHASLEPAPSIVEHQPDLAGELAELVAVLLEKKPGGRPTAADVALRLAPFGPGSSDEQLIESPPPPRPPQRARPEPPLPQAPPRPLGPQPTPLPTPAPTARDADPKQDSDETDSEILELERPEVLTSRPFDPVRAAVLGLLFAILFFVSSEGTRFALRILQK